MKNLKYIIKNKKVLKYFLLIMLLVISKKYLLNTYTPEQVHASTPQLWKIQSIDTMKTSRDKAREKLSDLTYDENIKTQLQAIKNTGANYVAIDTPYDYEFLPYLKRWVNLARENNLHVWFRGNWSSWEGWFDYPKNMTPEDHLKKTTAFVLDNPDLFADDDIFDSCPECENSHNWPQPIQDDSYNKFILKQYQNNKAAFNEIDKKVITNIPSIIGGRAREVLQKNTIKELDNVVAIDHYVNSSESMRDYLDYFSNKVNANIVISEFGAPIPDINGDMSEEEQANFIDEVFNQFYQKKSSILGINYFALIVGSTPLLNYDYSQRKAYDVIKNYFSPAELSGIVFDELGDPVKNVTVKSTDGYNQTTTDKNGNYSLIVPSSRTVTVQVVGNSQFNSPEEKINITSSGQKITQHFTVIPKNPDIIYKSKLLIQNLLHKN